MDGETSFIFRNDNILDEILNTPRIKNLEKIWEFFQVPNGFRDGILDKNMKVPLTRIAKSNKDFKFIYQRELKKLNCQDSNAFKGLLFDTVAEFYDFKESLTVDENRNNIDEMSLCVKFLNWMEGSGGLNKVPPKFKIKYLGKLYKPNILLGNKEYLSRETANILTNNPTYATTYISVTPKVLNQHGFRKRRGIDEWVLPEDKSYKVVLNNGVFRFHNPKQGWIRNLLSLKHLEYAFFISTGKKLLPKT